ncbi:MAG: hypothetical protein OIN66_15170 [Candidatus Methanoperedens sp.]|nr:hypothetical protein [Candidatus Methanoperedens sp.]
MRNKLLIGAIVTIILLSSAALYWYFTPANVSIVSIESPSEVGTLESGFIYFMLQSNASDYVNVTLKVKNALEDEKGNSIPSYVLVYGSDKEPPTINEPTGEVSLKPGINQLRVFFGYQVPGQKKFEVEIYQKGRLIDAKSAEITVLPPVIGVSLQYNNESRPGYDLYKVYGSLSNTGKGRASGVVVNISIINETTNTTVSSTTKGYSIDGFDFFYPMSIWEGRDKSQATFGPIALVELSSGVPSNEKYLMASTVAKGKIGDRYRVVVTARWQDQIAKAEMAIPP